jgi:hypothetical protein
MERVFKNYRGGYIMTPVEMLKLINFCIILKLAGYDKEAPLLAKALKYIDKLEKKLKENHINYD